jgi:hypothetical protein
VYDAFFPLKTAPIFFFPSLVEKQIGTTIKDIKWQDIRIE